MYNLYQFHHVTFIEHYKNLCVTLGITKMARGAATAFQCKDTLQFIWSRRLKNLFFILYSVKHGNPILHFRYFNRVHDSNAIYNDTTIPGYSAFSGHFGR